MLVALVKGKKTVIDFQRQYELYSDKWTQNVTLSELEERVKAETGITQNLRILFGGSVMKGEKTLDYYGLTSGSKIMVLGEVAIDMQQKCVNGFEMIVRNAQATFDSLQNTEADCRRVSEYLLRFLLKIDEETLSPDWIAARTSRKEAVCVIQSLLSKVDQVKSSLAL
jgi:hypothetical protein